VENHNASGLPVLHQPYTSVQYPNHPLLLRESLLPSFVALPLLKNFDQFNKLNLYPVMNFIKPFKGFIADLPGSSKTLITRMKLIVRT
jgi:hypothetical protein